MIKVAITDGREDLFSFKGEGNIQHSSFVTCVQCHVDWRLHQQLFPKGAREYVKKLLIRQEPHCSFEQNALKLLYDHLEAEIYRFHENQQNMTLLFTVLNRFHPTPLVLNDRPVGTLEKGIWANFSGSLEMHFNLKSDGKLEIGMF